LIPSGGNIQISNQGNPGNLVTQGNINSSVQTVNLNSGQGIPGIPVNGNVISQNLNGQNFISSQNIQNLQNIQNVQSVNSQQLDRLRRQVNAGLDSGVYRGVF
jgi:hypothetical protein